MLNGFTLHGTSTASPASAEILNKVQKAWSFLPNLHRVLAESPAALEAYSALSVKPAAIAAVREGRPIDDPKLEALRQFAAKITRQRGVVSEADVSPFKAVGYDNRAVPDVLVLAAAKLISNYTNHLAQTPNDPLMKGAERIAPGKRKSAA